jgi:hypothetical protein
LNAVMGQDATGVSVMIQARAEDSPDAGTRPRCRAANAAQVGSLVIRVAWDCLPRLSVGAGVGVGGFIIFGVLIGSHRAIYFCKISIVVMAWSIDSMFQGGVRTGETFAVVLTPGRVVALELA